MTPKAHLIRQHWWWLSFCDASLPKGEQFLGVCIIGPALDIEEAVILADANFCDPGGEVVGVAIPREVEPLIPVSYRKRLLTRAEAEQFDEQMAENHPWPK